jgi:hypothetical protein
MTFSSQRVDRVGQGRRGERRLTKGGDRMGSAEVRGDKRWRFPGCFLQVHTSLRSSSQESRAQDMYRGDTGERAGWKERR